MVKKLSVIIPTNRRNTQEQLEIIHNVKKYVQSCNKDVFCKEFSNLTENYVDECNHILVPTLLSLCNQSMDMNDYEVILCHKYPEDVDELIKSFETRINIKVIKEKPSIWHSLGNYSTVNNIRNTGIINASGELIVFMDDLSVFNNSLLQDFWNEYQNGYYCTAKAIRRIRVEDAPVPSESLNRKIIIDGNMRGSLNFIDMPLESTISTAATWSYCTSVSMDECLQINGFDEVWDGSFGGTDQDFGRRLAKITKYRRKLKGMIYEFSSLYRGKIKLRNDEMFRLICNQSPNPIHIQANYWKPTNREMKRYEAFHKTTSEELDENWNMLMKVPLYDLNEERKKNLHL